jgi:hypothetical protein
MSAVATRLQIVVIPAAMIGADRVEVCNECATGTHLAPEHIRGEFVCTYLSVDCPLCGRVGMKTRACVRRISP